MAAGQNPFSIEEDLANPFADPSIQSSLSTSTYAALGAPRASDDLHSHPAADFSIPMTSQLPSSSTSASTQLPTSIPSKTDAALSAKEQDLLRRERELAAREATLRQKTEALERSGLHPPNWPPFYPYIYHDIDVEVPEKSRPLMWNIYRFWLATVAFLIFNMFSCLTLLLSHPSNLPAVATDFGVSIVYMFFISAASFYLWYRPIYSAFKTDNSLYFYIFLLFNGAHIAFCFYMGVGIPGAGSAGFINMLAALSDGKIVAGVFCIISLSGWICGGLASLYLWKQVHDFNRAAGHTLEGARNEAVSMGVRSGVVQEAARSTYIRSDDGQFSV
ncbi:scamp family-domain-containing protein [Polychytrium aggregatum]|uniref:scamp family-domain-containing protein n=1 Tax=Polychytrium aggregatum TaxID=110093 RepID=UPI0022FF3923|nr:scamp family-domain-containing protein [Polychytrium aggregatum]KAI9207258.1 scamp family-domain-containing protein [Polychytrium aggregatum]